MRSKDYLKVVTYMVHADSTEHKSIEFPALIAV